MDASKPFQFISRLKPKRYRASLFPMIRRSLGSLEDTPVSILPLPSLSTYFGHPATMDNAPQGTMADSSSLAISPASLKRPLLVNPHISLTSWPWRQVENSISGLLNRVIQALESDKVNRALILNGL